MLTLTPHAEAVLAFARAEEAAERRYREILVPGAREFLVRRATREERERVLAEAGGGEP